MKTYVISTLDSAQYTILSTEEPVGGSRPRLILRHNTQNGKFLLKTYNHNSREVFAEFLASQIGKLVGLNIQIVSMRTFDIGIQSHFHSQNLPPDWKPIGALVRHAFKRKHDIVYGQRIARDTSTHLSLSNIERSIKDTYYAPEDLLQGFADMIIFDAFIGNMDRHHENWGIMQHSLLQQLTMDPKSTTHMRSFAPLFDHGSSLLFELDEAKVKMYLSGVDNFRDQYIFGKKYAFFVNSEGSQDNVFSIIQWYIVNDEGWRRRFRKALKRYQSILTLDLARIILKMPNHPYIDYSEDRKRLLLQSLIIRLEKFHTWL